MKVKLFKITNVLNLIMFTMSTLLFLFYKPNINFAIANILFIVGYIVGVAYYNDSPELEIRRWVSS